MKTHRLLPVLIAWSTLSGLLSLPARSATSRTYTVAVAGSYFFPQRVVWVGEQPPTESESKVLWLLLDEWRAGHFQPGFAKLELFLAAYTNSPWAPSLHANLGKFYRDRGLISPALEHWEAAWTLSRQYQEGHGKMVVDYTLAHWTRLLASLGRYETLAEIFNDTQGRALEPGPLSAMWGRTREAFGDMTLHPDHSYKCGTFALDHVAQALGLKFDARALVSVPSPSSGFSMKALADLSTQLGLGLVPVARGTDTKLVVPSVRSEERRVGKEWWCGGEVCGGRR